MIDEIYAALLGLDVEGASQPWPVGPLTTSDWALLIERCTGGRIVGTLTAAVERGLLTVSDQQFAQVARLHESAMITCVAIERLLVDTASQLDAAGIDQVVLKGPAIARTLYRNPSERQFIDIDILVEDIARAAEVLLSHGAVRRGDAIGRGFDRRFTKSITLVAPSGTEIDLHRTLAPGPYGLLIKLPDLYRHTERWTLAERTLRRLDREASFVHSCYHLALGSALPRDASLRDVALGLADDALDASVVLGLARDWQGEAVLAKSILACAREVPMHDTNLTQWARRYEVSHHDRALLKAYEGDGSRFAELSIASLRALKGIDRVRFAAALALPHRQSLATRSLARRAYLRRVAGRLLRRTPR